MSDGIAPKDRDPKCKTREIPISGIREKKRNFDYKIVITVKNS